MRVEDGAGPGAVEIALPCDVDGESRSAGASEARDAEVAEDGVEVAEVGGVEVDTDSGSAGHGVDAEKTGGLDLTGGELNLEPAQRD